MNVLLFSINTETSPYPVYPQGVALVAQSARRAGHTVEIYDFWHHGDGEEVETRLRTFSPDVVGISIRNIDNVDIFTAQAHWTLDRLRMLVERIKAWSGVPIVLGGAGFSLMPQSILEYCRADCGVVGEGEDAFVDILDTLKQGQRVTGLIRRAIDLKKPFLPGKGENESLALTYYAETGIYGIQTKRGCPFHCIYCSYPGLEGENLRFRDPQAVVDEIAYLKNKHGIDTYFFTDSVFNDPHNQFLEIAEALIRSNLCINWSAYFRPGNITQDAIDILVRSGLRCVEIGVDGTCDETLHSLAKGFDYSQVFAMNEFFFKARIPQSIFIVYGGPGETPQTIERGLVLQERLKGSMVLGFLGYRILPQTALQTLAIHEGMIERDDPLLEPVFYFSRQLHRNAVHARLMKAYAGRHDRIYPPQEGQERLEIMRRFGMRGFLWDKRIKFESTALAVKETAYD
ncbi:lipid biosynthesis B12-binding/radical SAM protein [Desulfovibrio inopinatus]|uniref:lipid biosynthesis B12-binding/radical SAM protein n=1 Tax=Desulfovibrio inopinatus TaxID=102109 RepID=UPI0003FEBE14|nr:lipid biosynthesis B12-binding/radical SAM protein [Desulfovibrio inopinatus]